MFTGLIEEIGTIETIKKQKEGYQIKILAKMINTDLKQGDSVSVNGICLTVTEVLETGFAADLMPESILRSNASTFLVKEKVNLERAMSIQSRFGGHIVSGHVDGIGKIMHIKKEGIARIYEILPPKELSDLIVEKGSIAIDGISLTVSKKMKQTFCVSVIPHSLKHTTLEDKKSWIQ